MSTSTNNSFALQEILLGISDSLNEAQEALRDVAPYDAYGRPNTTYQLPYLDFDLKVTSEFETQTTTTGASENKRQAVRFGAVRQPAANGPGSNTSKTEVLSTISGRFIAAVPNEGLPQTIIQAKTEVPNKAVDGRYAVGLTIELSNAAGERIADAVVEINLDEVATEKLNAGTMPDLPTQAAGEVRTDANGQAQTTIYFPASDFDKDNYFIFTLNMGTVAKRLSISKN